MHPSLLAADYITTTTLKRKYRNCISVIKQRVSHYKLRSPPVRPGDTAGQALCGSPQRDGSGLNPAGGRVIVGSTDTQRDKKHVRRTINVTFH